MSAYSMRFTAKLRYRRRRAFSRVLSTSTIEKPRIAKISALTRCLAFKPSSGLGKLNVLYISAILILREISTFFRDGMSRKTFAQREVRR